MNQSFVDKTLLDLKRINGTLYPNIQLITLWTIFEIYVLEKSGKKRAQDALDWFRLYDNPLKSSADDFWNVRSYPLSLAKTAASVNQRVPHTELLKHKLNKGMPNAWHAPDPNNKGDIAALIYEIRNNTVHGKYQHDWMSSVTSQEQQLVFLASQVMSEWITWASLRQVLS